MVQKPDPLADDRSILLDAHLKSSPDAPLEIQEWKIDGKVQPSKDRLVALTLDSGDHTIEVEATSGGRKYRAQVRVRVETRTNYRIITTPIESP